MPTVVQVRELPELCRLGVPRDWEDINGHVNVQYYLRMYDLTAVPMLEALGIDEDWVRRERVGLFDLEHHIWYLDEIHVGHEVSAHVRFADRNAKRTRGVLFLLDATRERLASAIEFVSTAAHLDTRRTVALPEPVAANLDAMIAAQAALDWPLPACGAISI
jgi:acyl-CoA thioester hydrolase